MPDHINDPGMPIHTAPFSTMVRDDNYVFLSGLVATDMEGGETVFGDIADETRLVMTRSGGCWRRSASTWKTSSALTFT